MVIIKQLEWANNALGFDPHEALWAFVHNLLELFLEWESEDPEWGTDIRLRHHAVWFLPASDHSKGRGKESDREKLGQVLAAAGYEQYESFFRKLPKSAFLKGRRGRPRTQGLNALRAFALYYIEGLSWRETTLRLRGSCRSRKCTSYCADCKDVARLDDPGRYDNRHCRTCKYLIRPARRRETICPNCADSIEDLVSRFLWFLRWTFSILKPRVSKKSRRKMRAISLPG